MLARIELRKSLKPYYSPRVGVVEHVRIPKLKCIMVDGEGDPQGVAFQNAMAVTYSLAYTLKFKSRKTANKDYDVLAPEGLWSMKGGAKFDQARRDDWRWTLLAIVPDFITKKMFSEAVEDVRKKKGLPDLDRARLEVFDEGECIQLMHLGPYSEEAKSIALLEAFARDNGLRMVGRHHEVYLGDPRRAVPAKLRTILRHPVTKKE